MHKESHHHFMSFALQLAERGCLTVSPNPMVGCVIVKDDAIVGTGFHQRAGTPHAEIHALSAASVAAQGATAYISLEPCCHHGKTPPCVNALIQAGIKKIYIACLDPNPLVAGKGIAALQAAGIEVFVGLCEAEAKRLNEIFFYYITHKRPFVIAKWAMSLDGKTITHPQDARQISGEKSQHHTHQLRQTVDAILVGATTARLDNPQLTVRLTAADGDNIKQPIRIILSSQGDLPKNLKMLSGDLLGKTIIATTNEKLSILYPLPQTGKDRVEVMTLPENKNKQVCLNSLLDELGKREITSLLVEGGRSVHESFFQENLVNKICAYIAPVIIGSLEKKQKLTHCQIASMGDDCYFSANYFGEMN